MKKYTVAETEQIMDSLTGIERAEASPFFYNHLRHTIDQQLKAADTSWWGQYKPVMVAVLFFIFLVINSFILLQEPLPTNGNNENVMSSVEDFSKEYNLNSSVDF